MLPDRSPDLQVGSDCTCLGGMPKSNPICRWWWGAQERISGLLLQDYLGRSGVGTFRGTVPHGHAGGEAQRDQVVFRRQQKWVVSGDSRFQASRPKDGAT